MGRKERNIPWMMDLRAIQQAYRGKRILITGHTGFKGAWLTLWLSQLGCETGGFALDPKPGAEKLFALVESRLAADWREDIRQAEALSRAVESFQPDFVFHLAAQPLVIDSYRDPLNTVSTNVVGTAHLLDALRNKAPAAHSVVVTTDKCYENVERAEPYREHDPLGGHDVYAASKASAEIITSAFRRSFFETAQVPGRVATARGGNVIGGGDYAENRILPDMVKALAAKQPVPVRNPGATRPWQHVLDCLSGYLALGAWLASPTAGEKGQPRAFNFGPAEDCERSVGDLVEQAIEFWPGTWRDHSLPDAPHEATRLQISIERAAAVLDWRPVWHFPETVRRTVDWYRADQDHYDHASLEGIMLEQIAAFQSDAAMPPAEP